MRADSMDPTIYKKRWLRLRQGGASAEDLQPLARQTASSFIDTYFQTGTHVTEYIDLLCEMATADLKDELGHIASSALFEIVIEKLCDDFEDLPVEAYCRVMCQVVSYCRTVPAGRTLDQQLTDFGIASPSQLYERALDIHTRQHRYDRRETPGKIILLSRVTIGADVAILSVMIQHLRRLFPRAKIVVAGSHKLTGLFGGNPDLRIRELTYARGGGLFERFAGWHAALELLREEAADGRDNIVVIDPDSRITQLGVLPLLQGDNYLFFNTRHQMLASTGRCMAQWANDWVRTVFGEDDFCYPTLWIPDDLRGEAAKRVETFRAAGARRVIAMNLGVGQNPRKRVGLEFERRLLRTLVGVPGTVVIVDSGFGADEVERARGLAADARQCGYAAKETSFADMDAASVSHGVITVACTIGQMAALIAHSDEYIGYDSACQHIAAAARTPTLTIFAGSNNKNFVRRWSACGDADCRIVHVNTLTDPQHIAVDEIVARIMQERANRDGKGRVPLQEMHPSRRGGQPAEQPTET
jgi:DNA-binding transcriptional LysR family regulator